MEDYQFFIQEFFYQKRVVTVRECITPQLIFWHFRTEWKEAKVFRICSAANENWTS